MEKQDGNFCSFLKFHRFAFSSMAARRRLGEYSNWERERERKLEDEHQHQPAAVMKKHFMTFSQKTQ